VVLGSAGPAHDARAAAPTPPDLTALATVPRHALPDAAVRDALARSDRPARPRRFAVPVALNLPLAQGRWQLLDDGAARWRLRLHSPGARSLSAHLAPLQLPAGAELWVYGGRGETPRGPYTAANVTPTGFWTPVVPTDELVLEVRVPAAARADVKVGVAEAFHGYEDLGKASGPGTSGSCNVDAACEAGTWGTDARSVALITIANQYFCSGQLLNNVEQDETPLFLTARHCGIEHERGADDSVNFYFNFAAPCGQAAPPTPDATVTGSTFLADDSVSDFTLLRLNGEPPTNAYFAGWNATGDGSASGASIHHPSGDEKKISLYSSPVARSLVNIGAACDIEAWEVQWSSGTTEGGSSGGGLWNAAHEVIGVLSGGTASCANPGGIDYYGRLERGWTAGTAPSQQLKAHLDPTDSCIAAIPGLDPSATPNAGPITSGPLRCEGDSGPPRCRGDGGGGGLPAALLAILLGAALARRRRA
jgi:lysyl endopeptidase